MGNCQAIDAATLVIQHPCGRSDRLYWPVTAAEVMKTNPGHYVALLVSSSLCPGSKTTTSDSAVAAEDNQVRVTRIKLLRPPDILVLGQVYRLITNQEVMKVLSAKKEARMMRQGQEIRVEQQHETATNVGRKDSLVDKDDEGRTQKQKQKRQTTTSSSRASSRSKSWQPTLKSITESRANMEEIG